MTLGQLQAFAAVARLGSVTAAARELGVSVPAVSAAVATLRRELGDELVRRTGHGVALTEGGSRLAAAAVEILGIADQARRSVAEARGGRRLLRIAATHEIAEFVAGPLIDAFTRARPALEVTVLTAQGADAEELLRDRRADVALGPRVAAPGTESVAFLRPRTAVVAAPTHRLAHARDVSLRSLKDEQWLEGPAAADGSTALSELLARAGVEPGAPRVYPSHAAALAAAAAGEGRGRRARAHRAARAGARHARAARRPRDAGGVALVRLDAVVRAPPAGRDDAAALHHHAGRHPVDPHALRRRRRGPLPARGVRHDLGVSPRPAGAIPLRPGTRRSAAPPRPAARAARSGRRPARSRCVVSGGNDRQRRLEQLEPRQPSSAPCR